MRFSPDFIERVQQSHNIVDIIGRFTDLKPSSGGRWLGLCPFPQHNEKTPSFSVSEARQVYHCFGCKESGNIYHFLQNIQGMNFLEAVEYLAHLSGISLPNCSVRGGSQRYNEEKQAWEINQVAADFFHKNLLGLPGSHPVRVYCSSRHISQEMIQEFHLGYASEGWEHLSQFLLKKYSSSQVALSMGLLRERSKGGAGVYDTFRGRLMFPIMGPANRYLGFGGRVLGEGQPKYLNSQESFIFHKGKVLYGLNWAARYIRSEAYVVIVEGYMDFLALQRAGVKNVVATLGTALTKEHCHQLGKFTKKVVVLFDGDRAGQEASQRSLPILLEEGLHPRICLLSGDSKDPDEFLGREGPEALKNALASSRDLFVYNMERVIGEVGNQEASDKVLVLDQLAPIYASLKDSRLREVYLSEVSRFLGVEKSWVRRSLRGGGGAALASRSIARSSGSGPEVSKGSAAPEASERVFVLKGAPKEEIYLLNLALMSEKQLVVIQDSGILDQISHPGIRETFSFICHEYRQNPAQFAKLTALLSSKLDCPGEIYRYLEEPIAQLSGEELERFTRDCCRRVREKFMKAQTRELSQGLKAQTTVEQLEKLERIMLMYQERHGQRGADPLK